MAKVIKVSASVVLPSISYVPGSSTASDTTVDVSVECVAVYALERILDHLSEENYPPQEFVTSYASGRPVVTCNTSEMAKAQYRGRAAARVIIKRRIAACQNYDAIVWMLLKDGQ